MHGFSVGGEREGFLCLPTDTDFNLLLTERCLLRECDFALLKFWTENYVYDALSSRKAELLQSGRYTCFKYPIRVFEGFDIVTKISFIDEKSFYVTQSILRNADKCLCATVLSVHQIVGTKMSTLLGSKSTTLNKSEFENVVITFQEFHSDYFKQVKDSWKGV
ncbi:protein THEM6-like [Ruditapes philippinarum]|uniref:protein THEM6-like n=1 Tax=Ruditapes philippinarum TaxID=129788 RepID=UPI00295B0C87|nr:protein THEM6-like [Ruditapes philippinarum]